MSNNRVDCIAYSRYKEKGVVNYARYAESYSRIIAPRLKIEKNWRCLDIACGKGNMLSYYRSLGVDSYCGVDITKSALDIAECEFGSDRIVHSDALEFLDGKIAKYELITALDFVEHISKDGLMTFLETAHESLSDNGKLLIRTPNPNAPFGMAARYNDITHQACYTYTAFVDIASRFGFNFVKAWEDIGYPKTIAQICHYFSWRALDSLYKACQFVESGSLRNMPPMTRNYWLLLKK